MSRTQPVDALRGFALLGIGIANLPYLALPAAAAMALPPDLIDIAARFAVSALFEGKFFVLFSFLFGWGFGVQLASAARAGAQPWGRYRARLMALAIFGVLHAVLVFQGDILLAYALLGLGLWPLRDAPPRRLVQLALAMGLVSALTFAALGALSQAAEALTESGFDLTSAGYAGSYASTVMQRLNDWPMALTVVALFNGPLAFGAFCLGLAAQKAGFFEPGSKGQAVLARRWPLLALIAVPANAIYAAAVMGFLPGAWLSALGYSALTIGAPALAAVYVHVVLQCSGRLGVLMPAGSMPLSGYIMQGLIAGIIFHGWGFGLFGTLGPAALLGMAVAIWVAVTVLAMIWKAVWTRGPFDGALRALAQLITQVWPAR